MSGSATASSVAELDHLQAGTEQHDEARRPRSEAGPKRTGTVTALDRTFTGLRDTSDGPTG